MDEVVVWTDGACKGNPGPGGWAAIIVAGDGAPVKNQDLVKALDAEIGRHAKVRWEWVRGHAASELNNRADELAVAAAKAVA